MNKTAIAILIVVGAIILAFWSTILAGVVLFVGWLGFGARHKWFSEIDEPRMQSAATKRQAPLL